MMRSGYLTAVAYLALVVVTAASACMILMPGEISGASTFTDYLYFTMMTTSFAGYGDMVPMTQKARAAVSIYVLFVFGGLLYFAGRHILKG